MNSLGRGVYVFLMGWFMHGYGFTQWHGLESYLDKEIEEGWCSVQERWLILDYVEQLGAPQVKEEAWAIEGLSDEMAGRLMQSPPWMDMVHAYERNNSNQKNGAVVEIRSELPEGIGQDARFSFRARNSSKWGLRMEPRSDAGEGYFTSGYVTIPFVKPTWSALIGSHRLGWGNRVIVSELNAFGSMDDPVFVLPVHYAYRPAWGNAATAFRNGIALSKMVNRHEIVMSLDGANQDAAALCRSLDRNFGLIAVSEFNGDWRVGACKDWSHHKANGILEMALTNKGWGFEFNLQRVPFRRLSNYFEMHWFQNNDGVVQTGEFQCGGQWFSSERSWRIRWSGNWEMIDQSLSFSIHIRRCITRESFWEIRYEQRQTNMVNPVLTRPKVNFRAKAAFAPMDFQLRLEPTFCKDAWGGMAWKGTLPFKSFKIKWVFASWDMPEDRVGHFPSISMDGVQFRPMRNQSYQVSMGLNWRASSRIMMELIGTRSQHTIASNEELDMLTLGYAQTAMRVKFQLRL